MVVVAGRQRGCDEIFHPQIDWHVWTQYQRALEHTYCPTAAERAASCLCQVTIAYVRHVVKRKTLVAA